MKKQLFTKIGLLLCSGFLITGCYNGWNNEKWNPQPQSSSVSSSETSEEPEPEPEEDPNGVDLTYPLRPGEVNPIGLEDFKQLVTEATGGANDYALLERMFGKYFVDFFRTHNHFTDKELRETISVIYGLIVFADNNDDEQMPASFMNNLFNYFARIDVDHLIATLQEIKQDKKAYGYFVHSFEGDMDGLNTFATANEMLNGEDEDIAKMAQYEEELIVNCPGVLSGAAAVVEITKIINMDHFEVFFRIVRRLARMLVINYTPNEITYLLMNIGVPFKDEDMEQAYINVNENLLDFINHTGDVFAMFNVSANSYGECYPIFNELASSITYSQLSEEDSVDVDWFDTIAETFENLFIGAEDNDPRLNPLGLRTLFKFIGMVGQNFTEEHLEALMYEPSEDEEEPEEGEDSPYQPIVDLYNAQYGLLTSDEKRSVDEATAAFGIQFADVITRLEQAVEDKEIGRLQDILNQYVLAKVAETFNFREPAFESEKGEMLILKQGELFSLEDFERYITNSNPEFHHRIYYEDEENENPRPVMRDDSNDDYYSIYSRNWSNVRFVEGESIDTSTIGQHYLTYRIKVQFENYHHQPSETQEYDIEFITPYYVISGSVEMFAKEYRENYLGNHTGSYGNAIYYDTNGCGAFQTADGRIAMQKDVQYAENELYADSSVRFFYVYDSQEKMFIDVRDIGQYGNISYYISQPDFDLNEVDNSTSGIFCAVKECQAVKRDANNEVIKTWNLKAYMFYYVLDQLPDAPVIDPDTPV